MHRPPRSLLGDTEIATSLEIDRCRAGAQRVIVHRGVGEARIGPLSPSLIRQTRTVVVAGIIDPFRRSHIFAVSGGMMVIPGDVAIKGPASGSSWVIRAYPPLTTRPLPSGPDTAVV